LSTAHILSNPPHAHIYGEDVDVIMSVVDMFSTENVGKFLSIDIFVNSSFPSPCLKTFLLRRKKSFGFILGLFLSWQTVKPYLQKQLLVGTYRFSPQQEIRFDAKSIELWALLDALVLKAVTLVLIRHLKPHISNQCVHVNGMAVARRTSVR
jgi:hypothetical protein